MGRRNPGNAAQTALSQRNRDQSDTYYSRVNDRYAPAAERADNLYNTILNNANSASNASYSPNDFESYGIFKGMAGPQGGIDPNRISSIDQNIAGFKEIGRTGGWSAKDLADTKLQASRVPTSIFAGLKQRADQQRNITGGYAPSGDARMAREAARAAAEGVLNSDISTAESVRQGKLAGLGGAQSAEMQLLDLISGQQRFGASGMSGVEGQALDATQRERLAGNDSLARLYSSSPGELDALFGRELQGRAMDNDVQTGAINRYDQQDAARRDRKMRAAQTLASAGTTAATMGAGGGRTPAPQNLNSLFSNNNSYYSGRR